jgi:hypothetical protein
MTKNKAVLSLIGIFLSMPTFAGIGSELGIKLDSQGKPAFGVQYAYDVDSAWVLTYTTTLSNASLAALPSTVKVNVIDTKTGIYLSEWQDVAKTTLIVGQYSIKQKSVLMSLLPNQRTLAVVFGVEGGGNTITPKFHLNIGKLCQNSPDNFVDLTQGKKGCDVQSSDLPGFTTECREWAEELLDYVKQDLITCDLAKAQYSKKGCGDLSCP